MTWGTKDPVRTLKEFWRQINTGGDTPAKLLYIQPFLLHIPTMADCTTPPKVNPVPLLRLLIQRQRARREVHHSTLQYYWDTETSSYISGSKLFETNGDKTASFHKEFWNVNISNHLIGRSIVKIDQKFNIGNRLWLLRAPKLLLAMSRTEITANF